jgi:hypothetical protein
MNWFKPSILYILDINGVVKFGVTSNWDARIRNYKKEVGDFPLTIIKRYQYEHFWQAELIEQLMKWQLKEKAEHGKHEYVRTSIPVVLNVYHKTTREIMHQIDDFSKVHIDEKFRWAKYKVIAKDLFDVE